MVSIKNIEDNLRYIAKRNKFIKYTAGTAVAFLLMGYSAFSEEVMSRKEIGSKAKNLYSTVEKAKKENKDKIKGAKLELIQLMEQADQVTKSPWASWQFGINYMYDDFDDDGEYKGRGDKKEKYPTVGVFKRDKDIMNRSISPDSANYSLLSKSWDPMSASTNNKYFQGKPRFAYGFSVPREIIEPNFDFELDVKITPKILEKVGEVTKDKKITEPNVGETVEFKPIEVNPEIPAKPKLEKAPEFYIPVYADSNGDRQSGANYYTYESFKNGNAPHAKTQNIPLGINGTWTTDNWGVPKAGKGALFKAFIEYPGTLGSYVGGYYKYGNDFYNGEYTKLKEWYFNSFNFKGEYANLTQAENRDAYIVNKTPKNSQYFFVGGSRFMEQDSTTNAVILEEHTVNLHGVYVIAMANQGYTNTSTTNKGTITDKEENKDEYIINMTTNATGTTLEGEKLVNGGDNYLKIIDVNGVEQKIRKSKDGYIGYKIGLNLIDESTHNGSYSDNGIKLINDGTIDFRGEKTKAILVYMPSTGVSRNPKIENKGKILLSGDSSYGIQSSGNTKGKEYLYNTGLIHLKQNPDGEDKANNSIGIALVKDDTIKDGVYFGRDKAINKEHGEIKLTDIENSTGVYVNIDSNITNQGKIIINSTISKAENPDDQKYNYGMRSDGEINAEVINDNTGIISLDGSYAYGMITKGSQIKNRGKITGTNISNGVGIAALAEGTNRGKVENSGSISLARKGHNIGIFLDESDGEIGTANSKISQAITVSGDNSVGAYADNGSNLTFNGNVTANGNSVSAIIANNNSIINGGTGTIKVSAKDENEAAKDSYGIITKGANSKFEGTNTDLAINVSSPKSIGLYSEGEIKVNNANIKAADGAVNFYIKDNGKISLNGGETVTGIKSVLFFKDGANGKISLNGKLNATIKGSDDNISERGTAFYYTPTGGSFNKQAIQDFITGTFGGTQNNLILTMEKGSRLFTITNATMKLSETSVSGLFDEMANKPTINGTEYKTFILNKGELTLDKNIDLDIANDDYNNLELASISIINNSEIKGTKASQSAIAQANTDNDEATSLTLQNKKTINLSGDKSVAIYGIRGTLLNDAGAKISVANNSVGMYGIENNMSLAIATDGAKIINSGEISVGENSTGIYYKAESVGTKLNTTGGVENSGKILINGDNSMGIFADIPTEVTNKTIVNSGEITINSKDSVAMIGKGNGYTLENKNGGTIKLSSTDTRDMANIGMYTDSNSINLINGGNIIASDGRGDNAIGMMGKDITSTGSIELGDSAIGIYSKNGNVTAKDIKVGNKAIGIYLKGNNKTITTSGSLELGENSFGINMLGDNNILTAANSDVKLKKDSLYIYSDGVNDTITNNTNLSVEDGATGVYGIHSKSENLTNNGDIDFSKGLGNIVIYSDGGKAINTRNIKVGKTNLTDEIYGLGMVAENGGHVINSGTISVNNDRSIAMYAKGTGSVVENDGTILLGAKRAVGIYVDEGAKAINTANGVIKVDPNATDSKKMVGIYLGKNTILENHGQIEIPAANGVAIMNKTEKDNDVVIKNYGSFAITGDIKSGKGSDSKEIDGVKISYVPGKPVEVTVDGKAKDPVVVNADENIISSLPETEIKTSSIGMYVDTSGINYTKPVEGLDNLVASVDADIIVGIEAAKNNNITEIRIEDEKILNPYNEAMLKTTNVENWNVYSGSLTWMAIPNLKKDGTIESITLAKVPYTAWATDSTLELTKGMDERYVANEVGSREKALFNKLNDIGDNEEILLSQAIDEMMGHPYSNVQQRVYETGRILDREFKYLRDEWDTVSKDSNKIKAFGMKGRYNTNTAGVVDYKNKAEGFAYLHEDETVKLGKSTGWYTGFVHNEFEFKDIGKSEEETFEGKLGIYKSVPFDHNNGLNWTISGEAFLGRNKMERRYLVVDELFNATSRYWTYGAAINNELTKTHRLSEDFFFDYYGGLKLEYGRFTDIKEKSGEMRLEVDGNDYFSVKPEIGTGLKYKFNLDNHTFSLKANVAYELELGEVASAQNKARVRDTSAGWYDLAKEKEDKNGNIKLDLNAGYDNEMFGVTANIGYDTKYECVRGGVGLRIIF